MDICIQLLLNAPTFDLGDPAKEARRNIDGDIVVVIDPTTNATFDGKDWTPNDVISSQHCGFIFVTGIPDGVTTIERINEVLGRPDITFTPATARPEKNYHHKREWNIDMGGMNPPTRNALLADRYVTISFTQLRAWCGSKQLLRTIDLTDFVV